MTGYPYLAYITRCTEYFIKIAAVPWEFFCYFRRYVHYAFIVYEVYSGYRSTIFLYVSAEFKRCVFYADTVGDAFYISCVHAERVKSVLDSPQAAQCYDRRCDTYGYACYKALADFFQIVYFARFFVRFVFCFHNADACTNVGWLCRAVVDAYIIRLHRIKCH